MATHRSARKGVVLLLILSLLVLFLLLGMTFMISAMRYRSGAESFSQAELRTDDPAVLNDRAVMELLREPANPYSSLYGQSLALDLYGRDGTGGVAANAEVAATAPADIGLKEVLRLDVLPTAFNTASFGTPSAIEDYYAGSVLSLLNGPGAPQSARVIRYIPSPGAGVPAKFYVEGFEGLSAEVVKFVKNLAPYNPNGGSVTFLVNGKPFNGSGIGYNLATGGSWDVGAALSPHYGHWAQIAPPFPVSNLLNYVNMQYSNLWSPPPGDCDESYDALDFQNMFLARNPAGGIGIVGSFHRPQLITYAATAPGLSGSFAPSLDYRTFRRRFIFRPMPWDHPKFTGSNPLLQQGFWDPGADGQPGMAGTDDDGNGYTDDPPEFGWTMSDDVYLASGWHPGPDNLPGIATYDDDYNGTTDDASELGWPGSDDRLPNDAMLQYLLVNAGTPYLGNTVYDVDNDGDGINDSFFLDLQLPVKTGKNGRLYKPLVAFLVCDQDGRINVNADGSLAQTQTGYHSGNVTSAAAPTGNDVTGPAQVLSPLAIRAFAGGNGVLTWLEPRDINGPLMMPDGVIDNFDATPPGGVTPNRDLNGDGNIDYRDRPTHGDGYGPAAINFRHLLDNPGRWWDVNNYQSLLLSRYGGDNMPASPALTPDFLQFLKAVGRPDEYANPTPATYGSWGNPSAYGSTPDVHERSTVALDYAGNAVTHFAGTSGPLTDVFGTNLGAASERANSPYDANLSRPRGDDQPFTPAELEAVLRWRDGDAGILPNRLLSLLTNDSASGTSDGSPTIDVLSKLITVHSSYIPAPPTVPLAPDHNVTMTDFQLFEILYPTDYVLPLPGAGSPQPNPLYVNAARIAGRKVDLNNANATYGTPIAFDEPARMPTIFDLMAAKIVQGRYQVSPPASQVLLLRTNPAHMSALQSQINAMLAFEFRRGQKMDPNRLWGNGEDNNGNLSVDEQFAVGASGMTSAVVGQEVDSDQVWGTSPYPGFAGAASFMNDDPLYGTSKSAFHPRGREMFARQLFSLMLLLVDMDYSAEYPFATPLPAAGEPQQFGFKEPYIDPSVDDDIKRRELTIRHIAQWAINCVDFRDADGIMTPFEYDVNPWNGYDVDGDPYTDDLPSTSSVPWNDPTQIDGMPHPDRRIVWGCEQPDLVLNETLAIHDRRVKDTKLDTEKNRNEPGTPDNDLDQYRIPQGSLFLELYCPRRNFYDVSANGVDSTDDLKVAPRELYNVDATNGVRLDLSRLAPADIYGGTTLQYPVWRMAISATYRHGTDQTLLGPLELQTANNRDNVSYQPSTADQPDKMYLAPQTAAATIPDLPVDRIVWFTTQSPAPFPTFEQNRVYYNRSDAAGSSTEIGAGQYFVVGPRAVTHIGSKDDMMTYPDFMSTAPDSPSDQVIRLVEDVTMTAVPRFGYGDFGYPRRYNADAGAPQVKVARTMVAAADPPPAWTANPASETCNVLAGVPNSSAVAAGVGLSVSEPYRDTYYPEPTDYPEGSPTANYPLRDSFHDPVNATGTPPDEPFDSQAGRPLYDDDQILETARHADYTTVFLQRLANPLLPWHATLNPYITVDWHSIDLTVFNGEDRERTTSDGSQWDPDDPNPNQDPASAPRMPTDPPQFGTRERVGQRTNGAAAIPAINTGLWNTTSVSFDQAEDDSRSTDYFSQNLRHSLGYLNRQIDPDPGHPNPPAMAATPTDANDFVQAPAHASTVGDPLLPFEWLVWNNRPYVSHLELMQVPASSPGRLLTEFFHRDPTDTDGDPYDPFDINTAPGGGAGAYPYSSYRASYGHLLNFFNTDPKTQPAMGTPVFGANYYRLLDFVEVPSRFAGVEKWYNPFEIRNAAATATDVLHLRPPFNFLSRFSEPGRINLNTAWDPGGRIWLAISEGYPFFANPTIWDNSSGTPGVIDSIHESLQLAGGPLSPSEYPNPLRAAGSATLSPPLTGDPLRREGVDATLLRSTNPVAGLAAQNRPLFDAKNYGDYTAAPANVAIHPRPNSYFRYQALQRMGNLVSGQSNVFAVWVTVAYFEVDPLPMPPGQDREHPDGFVLGQEVGLETGEVVRHRSFYLIDRSIPVAFEPGKDHNVEKMILLRRFIE